MNLNFLSISWPTNQHGRHYLKTVRIVYFIAWLCRSNQRELHAFLFNISRVLRLWDNLYLAALSVGRSLPSYNPGIFHAAKAVPRRGAALLENLCNCEVRRCNY